MKEQPLVDSERHKTVSLNVCDDVRNGREPFSKIMQTVALLAPDEQLRLIAPFEPVPLFGVLARKGFGHAAQRDSSGNWEVLFTREAGTQTPEAVPANRLPDPCNGSVPARAAVEEVDARGLEPPQPLVKILESLAALPADRDLRARTDRRPMHLYAQLEMRGFTGRTEEQSDGSFITHIRRR